MEEKRSQAQLIQPVLANHPRYGRKPVPGYRFFSCEECGHQWKECTRDCLSPSGEHCEQCGDFTPPDDIERHPEWPTDRAGNLLQK